MKQQALSIFLFVLLGLTFMVFPAGAQNFDLLETNPLIRFLQEFSFFLTLVFFIMLIILGISLHGAFKHIGGNEKFYGKLKLLFHFLSKDPAYIFTQKVSRDQHGTYQGSYGNFLRFYLLSKKTFLRTVGIAVVQIMIFIFLVYGVLLLTHSIRAQESNVLQSTRFMLQLDK